MGHVPTLSDFARQLAIPTPDAAFRAHLFDPEFQGQLGLLLQDVTAVQEANIRRALARYWRDVAQAVTADDPDRQVEKVVRRFEGDLKRILADAYSDVGRTFTQQIRRRVRLWTGELPPVFALDLGGDANPFALRIAARHAGRLVRYVDQPVRQLIRERTVAALTEGVHPTVLARRLKRDVPLLPHHRGSVAALEAKLLEDGVSPARARAQADRQAAAYAAQRANTIARTEMLSAANAGIQASWMERQAKGWLPPRTELMWMITHSDCRTCPTCRQMVGDQAVTVLGDPFQFPDGKGGAISLQQPPAHPRCRCTVAVLSPMLTADERRRLLNPVLPDC